LPNVDISDFVSELDEDEDEEDAFSQCTISFGSGPWLKYHPTVLKTILFPTSMSSEYAPFRKRRRVDSNLEMDENSSLPSLVFEDGNMSYLLITPFANREMAEEPPQGPRYSISRLKGLTTGCSHSDLIELLSKPKPEQLEPLWADVDASELLFSPKGISRILQDDMDVDDNVTTITRWKWLQR
jgi:hypothetical protein